MLISELDSSVRNSDFVCRITRFIVKRGVCHKKERLDRIPLHLVNGRSMVHEPNESPYDVFPCKIFRTHLSVIILV